MPAPAVIQAATDASCFGKNCVVCALIRPRSSSAPGQSGIDSTAAVTSSSSRALAPPTPSCAAAFGPPPRCVLTYGFAELRRVTENVAQIVGHLIGFAELLAERAPGRGLGSRRGRAAAGGGDEERAGLGPLVVGERRGDLALPGLPCDDTVGRTHRARDGREQFGHAGGVPRCAQRQAFEGQHDERVAGQKGDRLAKLLMHRRLAASQRGVVETGHVVMHERRAMQEFYRRRGGVSGLRIGVAASERDRETQMRADAVASREHGVAKRRSEQRRGAAALRARHGGVQSLLDALQASHSALLCHFLWTYKCVS